MRRTISFGSVSAIISGYQYAGDGWAENSYEDGHEDGLAMGLAEGKRLEQLHIIHNMFQENIPAQSCAKLLNKDTAFIDKVYSLCQAHPDWSDEDLYNSLKEN